MRSRKKGKRRRKKCPENCRVKDYYRRE